MKIYICEGKNEALLLKVLNVNIHEVDLEKRNKEELSNLETKIFRKCRKISERIGNKDIAKIEGGITKIHPLFESIIEKERIEADEIIVLCDNERNTLKKLEDLLQKIEEKSRKLGVEFKKQVLKKLGPPEPLFYYKEISYQNKVRVLIANPKLEELVKKLTGKTLQGVKNEKIAILKEFMKCLKRKGINLEQYI